MNTLQQFPRLTPVTIFDDDMGYYIQNSETGERLDIRFNTPVEAFTHARIEYWVLTDIQID
jgi:hypothetical protein